MSLQRGDVLICEHEEALRALSNLKVPLDFPVPLVYAPQGIKKLSRQDLLNLLEQLDQQDAPPAIIEQEITVPA